MHGDVSMTVQCTFFMSVYGSHCGNPSPTLLDAVGISRVFSHTNKDSTPVRRLLRGDDSQLEPKHISGS